MRLPEQKRVAEVADRTNSVRVSSVEINRISEYTPTDPMAQNAVSDTNSLINFLQVHPLLGIGMMLLFGYALARLVQRIGLPEITGFIIAGLIMGGGGLAVVGEKAAEELAIITEIALGLIALTIGGELRIAKLRRIYHSVAWITGGQFVATFVLVSGLLLAAGMPLLFVLLLGVIATSTSPAAVVSVVRSTRARGAFVDQLFGTVALGAAITVASFGIVMGVLPAVIGSDSSVAELVFESISELSVSLFLGGLLGFLIYITTRSEQNQGEVLILTLGFLFLSTATAAAFGLSPLLMNMAAGAAVANLSAAGSRVMRALEPMTPPIYALFFVIAGTKLNPAILLGAEVLLFGTLFIVGRWVGKYFGTFGGVVLADGERNVRNWLGLSLFPQAGVALGLVLLLESAPALGHMPALAPGIVQTAVNVVLMAVFVNEISGPPIVKYAIYRALKLEGR